MSTIEGNAVSVSASYNSEDTVAISGISSYGIGVWGGTEASSGIGVHGKAYSGGTGAKFEASSGGLGLWVSQGNSRFDGNVGIGTTDPNDKLSVGNKVLISDSTNPSNPPSGGVVIFVASDGDLKAKNHDGIVRTIADFY